MSENFTMSRIASYHFVCADHGSDEATLIITRHVLRFELISEIILLKH